MQPLKNFINILRELNEIINDYKKKYLILILFIFTILSSIVEVLTIGSLIPLMKVLINTETYISSSHDIFKQIINFLNVIDIKKLIIIIFTILIIFSYLLKILLIWMSAVVTYDISLFLNNKIFKNTISKNYTYFVNTNTSMFISNQEKTEHVRGVIFSVVQLFVSLILAGSIIIFLFYLNFKVALLISIFVVFSYSLFYTNLKKKLIFLSNEHVLTLNDRFKFLIESSENIKEIKLRNLKKFFIDKFNEIILRIKYLKIVSTLIHAIPGQLILLFGTIFLLSIMYYYSVSDEGLIENVPFIAALILAAQRIFPQAQNVFVSLAGIKEYRNSLTDIKALHPKKEENIDKSNAFKNKIKINKNFELQDIYFKHSKEKESLFENTNIKFEINKFYGIKGPSGIGKTSIIDVICGLLPSKCRTLVDGNSVDFFENINWQENISHLPQNTLLTDSTILENIAYGEKIDQIDINRVHLAAKKANIFEFISKSPNGFQTKIGEKGIKISGGQRQRISIAKLFYLDKKIFILDESTNALDRENEEKIFDSLKNNNNDKIIIAINHNLEMHKYFDHIYEIKDKKFYLIK